MTSQAKVTFRANKLKSFIQRYEGQGNFQHSLLVHYEDGDGWLTGRWVAIWEDGWLPNWGDGWLSC